MKNRKTIVLVICLYSAALIAGYAIYYNTPFHQRALKREKAYKEYRAKLEWYKRHMRMEQGFGDTIIVNIDTTLP